MLRLEELLVDDRGDLVRLAIQHEAEQPPLALLGEGGETQGQRQPREQVARDQRLLDVKSSTPSGTRRSMRRSNGISTSPTSNTDFESSGSTSWCATCGMWGALSRSTG